MVPRTKGSGLAGVYHHAIRRVERTSVVHRPQERRVHAHRPGCELTSSTTGDDNKQESRQQLLLALSWVITMHKSEGQWVENIVIRSHCGANVRVP